MAAVASALFLLSVAACSADDFCTGTGGFEWSKQLRSVYSFCDTNIESPDKQLRLNFSALSVLSVFKQGESEPIAKAREPIENGMVSWSPKSDAFFVNDGQGSGQDSILRLFFVRGNQLVEDGRIEQAAKAFYQTKMKCSPEEPLPNVWGLGWSHDGKSIYFFVQAAIEELCDSHRTGTFYGGEADAERGAIINIYSEAETKVKFAYLLPPNMLQPEYERRFDPSQLKQDPFWKTHSPYQ